MFKDLIFKLSPKHRKMIKIAKRITPGISPSQHKKRFTTNMIQNELFTVAMGKIPRNKEDALKRIQKHPFKRLSRLYYDKDNRRMHYVAIDGDHSKPIKEIHKAYMAHNPKQHQDCKRIAHILNRKLAKDEK